MKKAVFIVVFFCCVTLANAQSKDGVKEAKHDANRELNNGMRTGRNAGDNQKVNDARAAKENVRAARSAGEVRQAVKDYRSGSPDRTRQPVDRKPNGTVHKAY